MNHKQLLKYSSYEKFHAYVSYYRDDEFYINEYLNIIVVLRESTNRIEVYKYDPEMDKADWRGDRYQNLGKLVMINDIPRNYTELYDTYDEYEVPVGAYKIKTSDLIESYNDDLLFSLSTVVEVSTVLALMDSVNYSNIIDMYSLIINRK